MAFSQAEYYNTVPTPLSVRQFTPYQQQYIQSRGTWPLSDYDQESWMIQENQYTDDDNLMHHYAHLRQTAEGERQADSSLASWKFERLGHRASIGSRLNISARGSTANLRDFLQSRGKTKISGLHLAAAKSDVNAIAGIIRREGPNVLINELDENECTPLMYAVLADSIPAIELLLHCGAKREETDSKGRTAVHYAAFFGKAKALKFLIESAAHWMSRDINGRTPLHWSIIPKDVKCLQILIRHSNIVMGTIDIRDYEGMTPLHCAAQYCQPKHVQVLYEANCDYSITDIEGRTPLHWTVANHDSSCIEALISCFPVLLNVRDIYGQTILHLTTKQGAIHLVEQLLSYEGIEIDVKDNREQTPLHVASIAGQPGPVKQLLLHNALDSCIDESGFTSLHHAVLVNSSHCVEQLVNIRGSIVTHVPSANDVGQTPLMMAASNGHNDILLILLDNDEIRQAINDADPRGFTALHLACESGADDCVQTLISRGANPNLIDKSSRTPLMLVCANGNANCVEWLIKGGTDLLVSNQEGHLYLQLAVHNEHVLVVEQLAMFGMSIEALDAIGITALQLAVNLNSSEMIKILLDKGANPNALSMEGLSSLHYAAKNGNVEILDYLLEKGGIASIMDETADKFTPLDYAEQNNHSDCVMLLKNYGGLESITIKNMAASCIQNVYRNYRTRQQLKILNEQTRAAIVIQLHLRGFLARKWYSRMIKEKRAVTKIQAIVRGFIQRQKFQKLLEIHRLEENQSETIEKFAHLVSSLKEKSVIQTISLDMPQKQSKQTDLKKDKVDEQTRKERSLQMREIYLEKQKQWEAFRQAENQRRIDKEFQQKMNYMRGILKGKNMRRQYTSEHFQYTTNVRSHSQAATIIQRSYREYKYRQEWWDRVYRARIVREQIKKLFAAAVIQNAWKKYKEWKQFENAHMYSIYTNPVVKPSRRHSLSDISSKGLKSYERSTLVSGIGRRKLHQTQIGGFKIFKPIPTIPAPTITSQYSKNNSNKQGQRNAIRRPRMDRMERMKTYWPWADNLLHSTDNSLNGRHTNCNTTTNCVKLPKIN